MATAPSFLPPGHNCVSPYLIADGAARVIDLICQAFGGEEISRHPTPDGKIMHAEVRIRDSVIMLSDGSPEFPPRPVAIHVYVPDCDAAYARALQAGATSERPPADQFYGDRNAGVIDSAGNHWWIATHKETLTDEEIARRAAAAK